jgi:SAM-dependent methyltransferase
LESNLNIGTRRLCQTSYIVVCATTFALSVANLNVFFLDSHTRLLLILIGEVPIALFLMSFYLYESRTLAGKGDVKQLLLTVAVLCVLTVPMISLLTRYDLNQSEFPGKYLRLFAQLPIFILGMVYFRPIFASTEYFSYFTPLADHLKYIMWDSWMEEPHRINSIIGWTQNRSELFRDKDSLLHFQATLINQAVDASELAILLSPHFPNPTALSIIDAGCGDGSFTKMLLLKLVAKGHSISEIVGFDPVDWQTEYIANCKNEVGVQATFERRGFLESPVSRQYDLVLSSHSLYAVLDGHEPIKIEKVIDKLMSWKKLGGVAVIILASRRSPALMFKFKALKAMFGTDVNSEVAGEDLIATLSAYGAEPVYVDDIMDLTELMEAWESGNPTPISCWLNYFLRYPVSENRDVLEYLVNDLCKRIIPLDSLPEYDQHRYQSLGYKRTSLVLMHKVMIWTIK